MTPIGTNWCQTVARSGLIHFAKAIRGVSRRLGRSGSALPGLIVEKVSPRLMRDTLNRLPRGVVVISGTNGKTTTTKVIVELLRSRGLKVLTNSTGSNFVRGVLSAMIEEVHSGSIDADIAVLELDEAHAVRFARQVRPRVSVVLNVFRDQMDRFGEIDTTARYLGDLVAATRETVVLNWDDPLVSALAFTRLAPGTTVRFFGHSPDLGEVFQTDDGARGADNPAPAVADVLLISLDPPRFIVGGARVSVDLALPEPHNALNCAAALAAVRAVLGPEVTDSALLATLATIGPADGRGTTMTVAGAPLRIDLVKNPAGFRMSLRSSSPETPTLIAVFDEYADGRDTSWLWDVDYSGLDAVSYVTGTRAADMALRLAYDQVPHGQIEPDLTTAVESFVAAHPGEPKHILSTYSGLAKMRRIFDAHKDDWAIS